MWLMLKEEYKLLYLGLYFLNVILYARDQGGKLSTKMNVLLCCLQLIHQEIIIWAQDVWSCKANLGFWAAVLLFNSLLLGIAFYKSSANSDSYCYLSGHKFNLEQNHPRSGKRISFIIAIVKPCCYLVIDLRVLPYKVSTMDLFFM